MGRESGCRRCQRRTNERGRTPAGCSAGYAASMRWAGAAALIGIAACSHRAPESVGTPWIECHGRERFGIIDWDSGIETEFELLEDGGRALCKPPPADREPVPGEI